MRKIEIKYHTILYSTSEYLYSIIMPFQFPSVFIPRVAIYHDEDFIANIFWNWFQTEHCPVDHIDLVEKTDHKTGQPFWIAFVFFHEIPDDQVSYDLKPSFDSINSGNTIKIVHSYTWYWQVKKNTGKKKTSARVRVLSVEDEAEIHAAQKALLQHRGNPPSELPPPPPSGVLKRTLTQVHEEE